MDIAHYFDNPEELNKETLYELRNLIALYPFYQPARILLLKNLFLLHDATFDEELRRAAIYITNRRVLFNLVEAAHYQLRPEKSQEATLQSAKEETPTETNTDRTVSLIDNFLEQIPDAPEKTENGNRKPTPVDATVDYVAYLMNAERQEEGRDEAEYEPENIDEGDEKIATAEENGYFTETLARIYIKQGRYSKALEIINRLNLVYPKKSRYFADQIRFLQKLIINNNKK